MTIENCSVTGNLANENARLKETIAAQAAVILKFKKHAEWNKRIKESVDKLLSMAGYHEESSTRHHLSLLNFDAVLDIQTDSKEVLKEWLDSVMGEPVAYMNGSSSVISSKQKQDVLADADLGGEFASAALTASKYSAPLFRKPEVTK